MKRNVSVLLAVILFVSLISLSLGEGETADNGCEIERILNQRQTLKVCEDIWYENISGKVYDKESKERILGCAIVVADLSSGTTLKGVRLIHTYSIDYKPTGRSEAYLDYSEIGDIISALHIMKQEKVDRLIYQRDMNYESSSGMKIGRVLSTYLHTNYIYFRFSSEDNIRYNADEVDSLIQFFETLKNKLDEYVAP